MDSVGKEATPLVAETVVVPDSVPPPGLLPIATVMLAAELGTVLPNASCTDTCTVGVIGAPATATAGCTVKATWVAAAGLMLNGSDVSAASGAEDAASV